MWTCSIAGLLAARSDGFTIMEISDVHVGPDHHEQYVQAIVGCERNPLLPTPPGIGDVVDLAAVEHLAVSASPLGSLRGLRRVPGDVI